MRTLIRQQYGRGIQRPILRSSPRKQGLSKKVGLDPRFRGDERLKWRYGTIKRTIKCGLREFQNG